MNYETTRRYARSLAEAFPRDHADPIERPVRSALPYKAVNVALAVSVCVLILILCFGGAV